MCYAMKKKANNNSNNTKLHKHTLSTQKEEINYKILKPSNPETK